MNASVRIGLLDFVPEISMLKMNLALAGQSLKKSMKFLKKSRYTEIFFSLLMYAKPSFAHPLQTAKMASSRTSAQNNGPRAQKNGPWV